MIAGKPARTVLVTAFCLVLAFGGMTLVNAIGSPVAAPEAQSPVEPLSPADGAGWRSGGPYGGDVQALALSPAFAADGLALAGGAQIGPSMPGGYGIARTTDRGATWELLQDEQHRWAVFDLAISPALHGRPHRLRRHGRRPAPQHRPRRHLDLALQRPAGLHARLLVRHRTACGSRPPSAAMGSRWSSRASGALYRTANRGDAWTNVLAGTVSAVAFSRDFATESHRLRRPA